MKIAGGVLLGLGVMFFVSGLGHRPDDRSAAYVWGYHSPGLVCLLSGVALMIAGAFRRSKPKRRRVRDVGDDDREEVEDRPRRRDHRESADE